MPCIMPSGVHKLQNDHRRIETDQTEREPKLRQKGQQPQQQQQQQQEERKKLFMTIPLKR